MCEKGNDMIPVICPTFESVLCILCFFFLIGRAQQVGLVGKRVGSSILGYLGYFRVYTIFQVSRNKEFTQNVSYTRQIG